MSKMRMVSTSIWRKSKKFRSLSPIARYLFLYLITNEDTELCGVYEQSLEDAAYFSGLDAETMKSNLAELAKANLAHYKDGWFMIPNYVELQRSANPNVRKGIESSMALVPAEIREAMDTLSIGYTMCSSDLDLDIDLDIDLDSDSDVDSPKVKTKRETKREKYADHVLLTTDQYDQLVDKWGLRAIKHYIDAVSDYQLSSGRRYKDAAAAVRTFIRKDIERGAFKFKQPVAKQELGFDVSQLGKGAEA